MSEIHWEPDVLGTPYEAATIALAADEEGPVVATLVRRPGRAPRRRLSGPAPRRAVLHVHGFADYFFQRVAADYWAAKGYDFYALDLRKYGRSLRQHQTANYVDDLNTYTEELNLAWSEVTREHDEVVLSAHSTGGLTVPLWVHDRRDTMPQLRAVVLNSPWLDMQGSAITRNIAMPVLRRLGGLRPHQEVPRKVSGLYTRSLHRDFLGEWDFNLEWKPVNSWPIYAGWIRAIRNGHARVAEGLEVPVPVLVLSSARSAAPHGISDPDLFATDIVLNVEQIRRRATGLGRHVTLVQIPGAIHDVTLSNESVRRVVFDEINRFLGAYAPPARATK